MLLPNADSAEIDPQKLHGYLLSRTHPVGRFKARFFAALGYSADQWQQLEVDLRAQHLSQDAEPSGSMPEGQRYMIPRYPEGTKRAVGDRGQRLVHSGCRRTRSVRDGISWRR
jgi:hypothetical protein